MNIKNKGFTLVELLGVIVVLAIVMGIAMYSMTGIIGTGKKGIYINFEANLKGAAENYFIDHTGDLPNIGKSKIVYADNELKTYLNDLTGPDGTDCNTSTNRSFVYVTRGANISNNFNLTYNFCLVCLNKSTGDEIYVTKVDNEKCYNVYSED